MGCVVVIITATKSPKNCRVSVDNPGKSSPNVEAIIKKFMTHSKNSWFYFPLQIDCNLWISIWHLFTGHLPSLTCLQNYLFHQWDITSKSDAQISPLIQQETEFVEVNGIISIISNRIRDKPVRVKEDIYITTITQYKKEYREFSLQLRYFQVFYSLESLYRHVPHAQLSKIVFRHLDSS